MYQRSFHVELNHSVADRLYITFRALYVKLVALSYLDFYKNMLCSQADMLAPFYHALIKRLD